MNAQFEAVHPAAREYVGAALGKAVAALQPGWILLGDCVLPGVDGKPPASLRALMMHPEFGIAMLDVMPGPTTPHAADHLRRLLEVGHFPVLHGGYPPIVYFCVPARTLPELGLVLGHAFQEQEPPDLSGGAAWVGTVQGILAGVPQPRPPGAAVPGTPSVEPSPSLPGRDRRSSSRAMWLGEAGLRRLIPVAGAALLAVGGLAGLQYFGRLGLHDAAPPSEHAAVDQRQDATAMSYVAPEAGAASGPMPLLARIALPGGASQEGGPSAIRPERGQRATVTESATVPNGAPEGQAAPLALAADTPAGAAAEPQSITKSPVRPEVPGPALPMRSTASMSAVDVPARFSDAASQPMALPEATPRPEDLPVVHSEPPAATHEPTVQGADLPPERKAQSRTLVAQPEPAWPASPASAKATAEAQPAGAVRSDIAHLDSAPPLAMPDQPAPQPLHEAPGQPPAGHTSENATAMVAEVTPPTKEASPAPIAGTAAPDVAEAAPSPTQPVAPSPQAEPQPVEVPARLTPAAAGPPSAPVPSVETAPLSATAITAALPATGPPAIPLTHTEPLPVPVQPEETAVSNTAAAASPAPSATKLRRPLSGASPAAIAALLARADALIAIGDVAAARLVYQRAAGLDSARAATATGKTHDPRFLQAIGAIGVVADPDAAAAWYRKGAALGDEDAAPLLGGLDVKASQ